MGATPSYGSTTLRNPTLRNAHFTEAHFTERTLRNLILRNDHITEPHFTECASYGNSLHGSACYGTTLYGMRMLRNLTLRNAHFTEPHFGCVPNTVTRSLLITSDSTSLHLLSQNLPIATFVSSSMNSELLKSFDLIYQPAVLRIQPIGANF